MKKLLVMLLIIPILVWCGFRIGSGILFEKNCEGYLKRAANANTVNVASKELGIALTYMEANKLTEGYTSVVYKTPDEDIGFWYNNIKSAKQELDLLPTSATPLEKTNVLMKLRETLVNNGQQGLNITVPSGISIYPNNTGWCLFGIASLISLICSCIIGIIVLSEY